MSLHQLGLKHCAVDVAVSKSGTRLAVLSDNGVSLYSMDITKRPVPVPSLLWRSDSLEGHVPRHVTFLGDEQVCILTDSWDEPESCLWVSRGEELTLRGPILEPGRTASLFSSSDHGRLYVQFQDGKLYEVGLDEDQCPDPSQTSFVLKTPSFTPEVNVILLEGQV
jgi:elongator complex protein 1